MRIGIVASALIGRAQRGGMATYARELITHLGYYCGDIDFTLFLHPLNASGFDVSNSRFRVVTIPLPRRQPQYWEQIMLPLLIRRTMPDLVHFVAYAATLYCPVPYVVTALDLTYKKYPHTRGGFLTTLYWNVIAEVGIRRAKHVITISECSKRDLLELLNLKENQVTVTYLAARPVFQPIDKKVALYRIRERYPNIYAPYLLFVGTLEPVKNLANLIKAYKLAVANGGIAHNLVIVGQRGWDDHPIYTLIDKLGIGHKVTFTGYVPDEDLPYLYSAADALVFPSLYEGFGLPIVEAMACGTPVITSNTSSLREIGGDAVLQVDPTSVQGIANGIVALCRNENLRRNLSRKGLQRAKMFSWDKCAWQTIEVYRQVISGLRGRDS